MLWFTHWLSWYVLSKLICKKENKEKYFLIIWSILPDIDFILPFEHRTYTHDAWYYLILFIFFYILYKIFKKRYFRYFLFLLIWIFLHLFLDILTWPINFFNITINMKIISFKYVFFINCILYLFYLFYVIFKPLSFNWREELITFIFLYTLFWLDLFLIYF